MKGPRKEIAQLIRKMEDEGWRVEWTNNGHIRWFGPHGEMVTSSSTPSDWRFLRRIEADIKRETRLAQKGHRHAHA